MIPVCHYSGCSGGARKLPAASGLAAATDAIVRRGQGHRFRRALTFLSSARPAVQRGHDPDSMPPPSRILGARDRRLARARSPRACTDRATAEDHEALPPRARRTAAPLGMPLPRAGGATRGRGATSCAASSHEAERAATHARRDSASPPMPLGDARYPPLLAAIPDPPPILWVRGDARASAAAGDRDRRLARGDAVWPRRWRAGLPRDLAAAGVVVVSGLARGIDSAAHAAALAAGGRTIGVLGCGVDRVYPAEHRELARNMEHAGAVVSEFPPGVPAAAAPLSRCATASSAGCRTRSSSSRRRRRAAR